jgi:acyl-CoA synthetase (AMP-forming)/AMP-acid ligase II/acyl carrier protein
MQHVMKTAAEISQWLVENIADRLEMQPEQIDADTPLTDYGLSSRDAIMLSGELEELLSMELPPELFYDYPQISQLAEKLAEGPDAFRTEAPAESTSADAEMEEMLAEMTTELHYRSFIDLLQARARQFPDREAFIFLRNGEEEAGTLTFSQLDKRARAIGAWLQQNGLGGERLLLLYPSSLEFVAAFFGCLYAGSTAVPAFPPLKRRGMERIASIVSDADAKAAMLTSDLLETLRKNRKFDEEALFGGTVRWVLTDQIEDNIAPEWDVPSLSHEHLAFLQYTSGSTGEPKGVMVSHGNILHNCRTIRLAVNADVGNSWNAVSWLPLYHDMGLIGHVLTTINMGVANVFMTPTDFLQKPVRWLNAITKYNGRTSAAPNFAFDYCVERITPEERAGLDLSSWEIAINGSEPVRAQTLERFAEAFGPYGFKAETFVPSFGMAETTLMVTSVSEKALPRVMYVDAIDLEKHVVTPRKASDDQAISKVSCGTARLERVAIVDPETFRELPENRVGEVWVHSQSVAKGYWNRPELSEQIFEATLADNGDGPFLRTGDLGYLHLGELYFTGRLKDLIIIRGGNHYPQDIELTVQESHPALAVDGAAAFSVDAHGEERLAVIAEVERTALRSLDSDAVIEAVRTAVAQQHDLQVYAVTLLSPGRLPRTTSGKTQRRAAKLSFIEGSLHSVAAWKLPIEDIEGGAKDEEWRLSHESLRMMEESQRRESIQEYMQQLISRTIKVAPADISPDKPVINLGLDSMHAIQIKGQIEKDLQTELDVTTFMQGATLRSLSDELSSLVLHSQPQPSSSQHTSAPPPSEARSPLDIDALSEDQIRELLTDLDSLSAEEIEALLQRLA